MTRVLAGLAIASAAGFLAGCGGSHSASSSSPSPAATPVVVKSSPVAQPGASFAPGQPATVAYTVESSSGAAVGTARLGLTVLSIQKGTLSDFSGIQLDANEKASTPDYVEVKLTNLGSRPLNTSDEDDPVFAIDGVDNTGQSQQSVTFLGTFPRCPDTDTPKPFSPGKSFKTCLTFLVPGGISKVAWTGTDGYDATPVTWGVR